MKQKSILLLTLLFCFGFSAFAQDNVVVTNDINTDYDLKCVYEDIYQNNLTPTYTVLANSNYTIYYINPTDANYRLVSVDIFPANCSYSLFAHHTYNTYDADQIDHCYECNTVANSEYDNAPSPDIINLKCR